MKTCSIALLAGMAVCAFVRQTPAAEMAKYEENVLYSFCTQGNCPNGMAPAAGLIDIKGTLFGTTLKGGVHDLGTVFALDPVTGAETVLHSFGGESDGIAPWADLIDVTGRLYGTTAAGGSNTNCDSNPGCGTIFALDPRTGTETVLHAFCTRQDCTDGAYPAASLISMNGVLYGTTSSGGVAGCNGYGCGTVFSIDLKSGTEKTLYTFCTRTNCADGAGPDGSLIDEKGTLYSTTRFGGAYGEGTVFSLDPDTGNETALHAFGDSADDGDLPEAGLIDVRGTLYGTTFGGGADDYGTAFALDPKSGKERVLYSFCSQSFCPDGDRPQAALVNVKDELYGTTYYGGNTGDENPSCEFIGCGTVFALKKIH